MNETEQETSETTKTARISIVDDDESVRDAIKSLLRSVGLRADVFASAEEFLKSDALENTACLILDVRMRGMSGLELQQQLAKANYKIPLIFITAHASDREARTRALQAGAIDVLYKPFKEEILLKHVYAALSADTGHDKDE